MVEVTPIKMSQFREGNFGRLESHDWGMPVYFRAAFMPDSWAWGAVGVGPLEDIGWAASRSSLPQFRHGSRLGRGFRSRDLGLRKVPATGGSHDISWGWGTFHTQEYLGRGSGETHIGSALVCQVVSTETSSTTQNHNDEILCEHYPRP